MNPQFVGGQAPFNHANGAFPPANQPPQGVANLTQKMQGMGFSQPPPQQVNGGFTNGENGQRMPPGQMPPGQMPPGQMPPRQIPQMPPVQNAQMPPSYAGPPHMPPPRQMPPGQNLPPSQTPPAQGRMPPVSSGGMPPGQNMQNQFQPGSDPRLTPSSVPSPLPPPDSRQGQMPPGPPQQGMPPGQMQPGQMPPGRMPSSPMQPAMPPTSMQLGMPPTSMAPSQMPPGPMQGGMPPNSMQQGQPASGPGMPSGQMQPGMPPGPMQHGQMPPGPGMPPSQMQPGMPPGPMQSGMPPSQMQQGMPPGPMKPGMQPGMPGQMPPNSMPGQMPPNQLQSGIPGQMPLGMPFNQMQPGMPGQMPLGIPPNQMQSGMPGQMPPNPMQPGMPGQMQGGQMPPGMPPNQLGSISGVPPLTRDPYNQQKPLGGYQQGYGQPQQQPAYAGQQQRQPGYPGQPHGYPGAQGQYGYQEPPKKLNPEQMPSAIQVMIDDQNHNSGTFVTKQKGLVPPLVTTDFIVDDQGNASPRYIRSSMYNVPATSDMIKATAVPFCVVISPLAEIMNGERPPPLLDFSVLTGCPGTGPVRCCRCKAYMCPSMHFIDAGRHFQCAFCKATTEVPMEYTQYLNNMQHYGQQAAELSLGCYEVVATKEYCKNNVLPNPPALIFVVDVSYNSVRSGMLQLVVGRIRQLLAALPEPPRIGLITYSSTIHFYNINENLAQPQMLVVGDLSEVFVPLSHGLLVQPGQADHLLEALAQQVPLMFQDNKETETILLPAIQAGLEALKAAECAGKLLVFHSSLPTFNAPGRLANRDDRKLLGTEKEKNVLNPQTKVYNELAQDCVSAGCGVDLFLFNNSYIDAATLGQVARLTGGSLHKYTYFQADIDGERFMTDLSRVLSRPTAYDAVMRVRTSTGIRATDFYGHFFMSNTTDVELATLDSDKAIGVEIKHDDKLTNEDGVYIQVALLYTHASGQRRLRILNLALEIVQQMADVYRCCDLDTTINYLAKQAIARLSDNAPKSIKEGIIARCAQTLVCYRKHCASPTSAGQLVLPESMKLLPLMVNCLIRSDALSGGADMTCDDRSWAMQALLSADVPASMVMLYPRLQMLSPTAAPQPLRCTVDKLRDDSLFLLENGIHMLLWVGQHTPRDVLQAVFGVNSLAEVNSEATDLPVLDTPFSHTIRELVQDVRRDRRRHMRLAIVRQSDKLETVFRHFLVEDQGQDGSASYVDFLCHMHKEIRALL